MTAAVLHSTPSANIIVIVAAAAFIAAAVVQVQAAEHCADNEVTVSSWTRLGHCEGGNGGGVSGGLDYTPESTMEMATRATRVRICTKGSSSDCVTSKAQSVISLPPHISPKIIRVSISVLVYLATKDVNADPPPQLYFLFW